MWKSPIPADRWNGFRRKHRGVEAFASLDNFQEAALNELECALSDHDLSTLGRLVSRKKKMEIELFIRTHGANPLFEPQEELDVPVGAAKADIVDLSVPASEAANKMILDGGVVHVLFQAGEASRFNEGPFYRLNPVSVAKNDQRTPEIDGYLERIEKAKAALPKEAANCLTGWPLGPKQPLLIRAALRRVVQAEINAGRLKPAAAVQRYKDALANQKLLFIVGRRGDVSAAHDDVLRNKFAFFGFHPENIVTIEQQLVRGITASEDGKLSLLEGDDTADAAGHLYALAQAARVGDFTTYTESGRPIKPMEVDALSYLLSKNGRVINVIRINDMDRHSTEIINAKALTHALSLFEKGYVNAIETVANPSGQKGGTGTTFGNPEIHVLTETHENSFPALSRPFEAATQTYLKENAGRHPAYNAMRQLAHLEATRTAIREFGGRIVFVPRCKQAGEEEICYLGVDMPMGDLSLLYENYKSRMFQFAGTGGRELLIHDVKTKENLPIALRTVLRQLEDPHVVAAAKEMVGNTVEPFAASAAEAGLYGAPSPEFEVIPNSY